MSLNPEQNVFDRFKRLYRLAEEPAREIDLDNPRQPQETNCDDPVGAAQGALDLLVRLKSYMLSSEQIPVARKMLLEMRSLADAAAILQALRNFERKLIALGGAHYPELAIAAAMVEATFPSACLVAVRESIGDL